MDHTQIHLMLNHLPVMGSILSSFVLAYGIFTRSRKTREAAYMLLMVSALGAGITYATGEATEEKLEHLAGISHEVIEAHEESAFFALLAMLVLGMASGAALYTSFKRLALAKTFSYLVLGQALIAFVLVAYTANLGGKIRHTALAPLEAELSPPPH